MSSRRMMTRSHSGEARSSYYNGDDVSGSSRPAGRSYLSNVRPENSCTSHRYSQYRPTRSTLCSVMAQLTEDIQPCFETTLKSKAVSETCNVKFTCVVTGYPTPEVIWYKDDVQLDRYCGLPKYEIFRNGQNHSLHIYDCTTEDAAIYQASASNSKGIVSCSGVLEVGVMSEYKIHQRYFAKLKQKAENKRRELEGKDNQGPGKKEQLRTISPDRSQRKRRSPMEGSLSTPSSIEDEGIEESQQSPPAEARLQETTVGEMEDKPVSLTNGAVSPITNGKVVSENGSKGITYIFDSVQKIFTAHQPKTPFAKKKIKISNGEKSEKTDSSAERMSEERRANEEPRVPPAPRDLLRSQGPLEEVMEIESTADSVKKTEQCQKMATEKAPPVNKIASEGEKVCVEGNKGVSSQKKRPTLPISPATVSPAARPSANHTVSGSQSEQVAELEKEVGNSDIEENLDLRRPGSPVTSMQTSPVATPQQPLSNAVKGDITKTQQEDVTVMEVNKKPTAAETRRQPVKPVTLEGLNTAEDSATVCPEHSDISVPIPHGTSETRGPGSADKACKREDAFLQRPRRESRDQLSEQETSPSLKNASVSGPRPRGERSQVEIAMKTVEGTEMQVDEKTAGNEVGGLRLRGDNLALSEGNVEMETEDVEANLSSRARNNTSPIPSATPQELASGARRKIFTPKPKTEDNEVTLLADDQPHKEEGSTKSSKFSPGPVTLSVSPSLSRRSPLVQSSGQRTPPAEGRSPQFSRRKMPQETPAPNQEATQQVHTPKTEEKPAEKDKHNPFKAPQVIRKIRGESFSDTSGHLKLWCQFFNVLSDSTIKWYRDEVEIAEFKRSAGDETQVNLAIVQASSRDCGVYGCTITNEYGTDSTDLLLSVDILAGMSLREDLGVGEEIEMTPLLLNKGLADSGVWGSKFFGRIMMQESHIGERCSHKAWRAKVIYGLEPVFESGTTCIIKVRNPLTYGGKGESQLTERNLDLTQQECRIQNLAREYCKIFSAEARVIENFGTSLEIIPVYLMYRPANTIPHATVEADLKGAYLKYSRLDDTGRLVMRTGSDVEQKCCALQHWIHQWTSGNLLLTRLEGVDTKITNVGISVKSTGYQGLPATGNLKVFEQFVAQHQCNYYCGLLSLRSLKAMDSLQTPSKPKGSRSPLLQRKMAAGSSSPQTSRKGAGSPRLPKKSESEQDSSKAPANQKNTTKVVNTR
ncbi:alpha-protein kinase 3 [Polymixia lowei]